MPARIGRTRPASNYKRVLPFFQPAQFPPPPVPPVFQDALPSVNFPAQPLDERVELLLNGTWTDVSKYVERDPNTVQRGHPDESTTTSPTVGSWTFQNGDGRFTEGSPLSPYYPYLRRNTPCRISLPEGASYLRLEGDQASYAQGPSSTNPAGDFELQLDVTLDNWNGSQTLACKWSQTGNQRSWLLEMNDGANLLFWVSPDGSAQTVLGTTMPVPLPPLLRQCIRVTYQASTGTATFYTSPPGLTSPVWTQVGSAVVVGAITPFSNTAPVLLGARNDGAGRVGFNGKVHAFLLLQGIGGSQMASPDFTTLTPGTTSFIDSQSNPWTLTGTSEVSNRKYRAHLEVPQWAQNQDPSGKSVYAKMQGGGLLRRMGMGQTPAHSAMTRAYLRLPNSLQLGGYWTCEDGANATQLASAIGGLPGTAAAGVTLASSSAFACSAPIPVMNSGYMTFVLGGTGPQVTWTDNVIRFLLAVPPGDDTNGAILATINTTGTISTLQLVYGTGGVLTLSGYNASGQVFTQTVGFSLAALELCRLSVELTSGGGSKYAVWATGPNSTSAGGFQGTFSGGAGTIGAVTSLMLGDLLVGSAIGHVSVQGVSDNILNLTQPLNAWQGEAAAVRFARLCSEERITCRIRGQASATPAMGVQSIQTVDALLQECVDADLGMWTELRQPLGFGYRTRASIGNAASAVTVSFNNDHMDIWSSDPTTDDQIIVNDVTVNQSSGGSSAHLVADTGQPITGGPMGVSLIGRYDQSYPVNVQAARIADNAGWRLRMGTVDEPRYPGIAIDLANAALYQQGLLLPLLDMDLGDRLTMLFPPGWLPPGNGDQIDQVMNGVLETMWVARILGQQWQGVPYSPWPMGIVGDSVYGWADTDGLTVHSPAAYGSGTILADTSNSTSPLWTTTGGDFPVLLTIQGMVIQASACSGSSSPQTFTIAQWGVNGVQVNLLAGSPISLAYQAVAGM